MSCMTSSTRELSLTGCGLFPKEMHQVVQGSSYAASCPLPIALVKPSFPLIATIGIRELSGERPPEHLGETRDEVTVIEDLPSAQQRIGRAAILSFATA